MLLIVGLGNPGRQYALNRHNVGFMAADAIHRRHGFPPWRRRFQAAAAEAPLGEDKCLLLKPQTYMNESGRAVQEAVRFYKLQPSDVVVIHDEVDLPPGKTRMKAGGGVAGHNGLRSINAAIGNEFRRLRIGVGHPGVNELVANYVLHDFAKADLAWLSPLLDAVAENAPLLAAGKDSTFANRLHAATGETIAKKEPKRGKAVGETTKSKPEEAKPPSGKNETGEGALARGLKKLFGR